MSRLIDADDIDYESIDSSDTNRYEYYYGTGIMAVRKEDIDAMPTIEPELRWIPCDEKLPEKPDIYMVTDTNGNVVRFIFDKTESSREYWLRCAKAWRPLPEPYTERKETWES